MWCWFGFKKKPQDPLSRLIATQKRLKRKVIHPGEFEDFRERLKSKYREELDRVLDAASSVLVETLDGKGVKIISLVFEEGKLAAWFNKRDPKKLILNLAINLTNPEAKEKTRLAIKETLSFRTVVKTPPITISDSWESHFENGLALARVGNIKAAIGEIERAYALNPNDKAVRYQLALLYFRRGEERGNVDDKLKGYNLVEKGGLDYQLWGRVNKARVNKQNVIDFGFEKEQEENL